VPTPIIEKIRVRLATGQPGLLAAGIETPLPRATVTGYRFNVRGWAVGRDQPVARIRIAQPRDPLGNAPVQGDRPDIGDQYPDQPWAARSGFQLTLGPLKLDPRFKLRVIAELEDGSTVKLATIRGRHRTLPDGYQSRLQPLLVTSLGRTGSTWLMRLLAEHPGVVTYRHYPYEVRPAKYWLHLFRILTAPPNPAKTVGQPNEFHVEALAAGANPFQAPAFPALPALEDWGATIYASRLADFCQQSIDEWYGIVVAAQDEPDAVYFAEKHFPDDYPRLALGLFPRARELVLVRDFRDMAASMLAYNEQRGFDDFGRSGRDSDEAWIDALANGVNQLAAAWQRRSDRAHLVRYEDLITSPVATMRTAFAYLELDASDAAVEAVIARAAADPAELKKHQTTRDPAASIGRWRQDLSPELQAATNRRFRHALVAFGYDPVD